MENVIDCSVCFEIKVKTENSGELHYILKRHKVGVEYHLEGSGYSIEISSDIRGTTEYVFLEDISRDYEEAVDLIKVFAKNTVTPESAIYIMEDLLS